MMPQLYYKCIINVKNKGIIHLKKIRDRYNILYILKDIPWDPFL